MSNESSVQIIPYYAQPHVHTVINDDTFYDETVATPSPDRQLPYSTLVITGADSGIDDRLVRLTDIATKQKLFGKSNYLKYGQSSLQAEQLFNGNTNVWFMRVLPDNASYANLIFLAHYRKGKILDELGLETGKMRLEIKFSVERATKDIVKGDGPVNDDVIYKYANSLIKRNYDPKTGYRTVPIAFIRSIGRGNYGNKYSVNITRDISAEKEYGSKMYKFSLMENSGSIKIVNEFAGSLVLSAYNGQSLLISDTLDQYATGSCPIHIYPFESNLEGIYDFYRSIVDENAQYVNGSGYDSANVEELKVAQNININTFDPLFGLLQDTQIDEQIPYYRNYTISSENGAWIPADLEVPATAGATKPTNLSQWSSCHIGARVLVAADPFNNGHRWLYTVVGIDERTDNIIYDEGYEVEFDVDQYDGVNISLQVGHSLQGGSDGDFESITVNGVTRAPSTEELELLLSKEYVKAFRGRKDRRILSPARIDLDFVLDANYNLSSDLNLEIQTNTTRLHATPDVLRDGEGSPLSVLTSNTGMMSMADINVKEAMYDLICFRNRDGNKMNMDQGAGCSLYLDCGFVGNFDMTADADANEELKHTIDMMAKFLGRQTSVDLGYYDIFDPVSMRKVKVTALFYHAQHLVNHLLKYGLNKPFVGKYASLETVQRSISSVVANQMIRDSFQPDIDLIDWDVKEKLFKSRINYWTVKDEGRSVRRSVQNTRQVEASALLEENNVRVLNTLKKNMEKACEDYLYEWNKASVRKSYTQAQMNIYRPWIGTIVEDLDIRFEANEWEEERMMMHCYVTVKFFNIVKRIVLEINIKKPDYVADEA